MTKKEQKEIELKEAKESLIRILALQGKKPVIYTVMNHVSQLGMTRHINCLIPYQDDMCKLGIRCISWEVARVLEEKRDRNDGGVVVKGCGMDMGFDLIYRLSYRLYQDSNRIEQRWI